jgi:peptidyl-prolyl cis-trans isomerase C
MRNAPAITSGPGGQQAATRIAAARPKPVTVNGVLIARDAIAREAQHHPAATPEEALQAATRALVIRELLLQESRRRQIKAVPLQDNAGRRETDDEAAMRVLVETMVTTPEPDEAACRRSYEANRARLRSPDIYEVRHILLAAAPGDAEARASARHAATLLIGQLQTNATQFSALAAAHSSCPSRAQGGSLGQISRGQCVPEFEAALAAMQPGTVGAEPVETRYGFHVVVVDRHIAGQPLPFEIARPQIAAWLTARSEQIGVRSYVADLVRQAQIDGVSFDAAAA